MKPLSSRFGSLVCRLHRLEYTSFIALIITRLNKNGLKIQAYCGFKNDGFGRNWKYTNDNDDKKKRILFLLLIDGADNFDYVATPVSKARYSTYFNSPRASRVSFTLPKPKLQKPAGFLKIKNYLQSFQILLNNLILITLKLKLENGTGMWQS